MNVASSRINQVENNGHADSRLHSATPNLHPAWQALIRLCREMGHGEIERIKIQDGLPVSAEVIRKKIRWL
jgi:hypothetical protein